MAHVALNFVMKWTYASRPVTITVLESTRLRKATVGVSRLRPLVGLAALPCPPNLM